MPDNAIETDGLSKVFRSRSLLDWTPREVRAVEAISLSVPRGTTFGLLGPSWAGKPTTVRLLTGLISPTSGEVTLFGDPGGIEADRVPHR